VLFIFTPASIIISFIRPQTVHAQWTPSPICRRLNAVASPATGHWGTCPPPLPSTSNNFIFSSLCSNSESQQSKYCAVCEISWCRCQQLTAVLEYGQLCVKIRFISNANACILTVLLSVCLTVRLSNVCIVTKRNSLLPKYLYHIKISLIQLSDRRKIGANLMGDNSYTWNFESNWAFSFQNADFQSIFALWHLSRNTYARKKLN